MNRYAYTYAALISVLMLSAFGCGVESSSEPGDESGKEDSSLEATVLDFEFDGELFTNGYVFSVEKTIEDQLLYTIGQLNGDNSVGRLDRLALTQINKVDVEGGTRITYHAKLPVGWGSKVNLPQSYEVILPRDVSYQAMEDFTKKYMHSCVEWGAHDVDSGSMWYYFRPARSGCRLADTDILRIKATATVGQNNTTGKYPEYHMVWDDQLLKVVAIFGKYEDGAVSDVGIDGYNNFIKSMRSELSAFNLTTIPAELPTYPGIEHPDVTLSATLDSTHRIEVTALLVDNVRTAGATFDERYESLSTKADLIIYNGHAGLGQNVRALARKGRFEKGKYLIVFMNGCDTFAYVDGSLAETRAALNPDDPTGTKYMEFVTNIMPSMFSSMSRASMAMVRGLLSYAEPKTYEQMFASIDSRQVVIVTGEEDNVFTP